MLNDFLAHYWHGVIEPIVVAVVTGCIGFGFYVAQRIFSAFVALAIARENAQDERLDALEAWRLRSLESAAKEVDGHADRENDDPGGKPSSRLRGRRTE